MGYGLRNSPCGPHDPPQTAMRGAEACVGPAARLCLAVCAWLCLGCHPRALVNHVGVWVASRTGPSILPSWVYFLRVFQLFWTSFMSNLRHFLDNLHLDSIFDLHLTLRVLWRISSPFLKENICCLWIDKHRSRARPLNSIFVSCCTHLVLRPSRKSLLQE